MAKQEMPSLSSILATLLKLRFSVPEISKFNKTILIKYAVGFKERLAASLHSLTLFSFKFEDAQSACYAEHLGKYALEVAGRCRRSVDHRFGFHVAYLCDLRKQRIVRRAV